MKSFSDYPSGINGLSEPKLIFCVWAPPKCATAWNKILWQDSERDQFKVCGSLKRLTDRWNFRGKSKINSKTPPARNDLAAQRSDCAVSRAVMSLSDVYRL